MIEEEQGDETGIPIAFLGDVAGKLAVVSLATKQKIRDVAGDLGAGALTACTCLPGTDFLFVGSVNSSVYTVSLKQCAGIAEKEELALAPISALGVYPLPEPGKAVLVVGAVDGTTSLWKVRLADGTITGREAISTSDAEGKVVYTAFDASNCHVLTISEKGTLNIFDLTTPDFDVVDTIEMDAADLGGPVVALTVTRVNHICVVTSSKVLNLTSDGNVWSKHVPPFKVSRACAGNGGYLSPENLVLVDSDCTAMAIIHAGNGKLDARVALPPPAAADDAMAYSSASANATFGVTLQLSAEHIVIADGAGHVVLSYLGPI